MSLLTIDHLSKQFGGLQVIQDVSMELNDNELVGLIGPNGAGKTTLFNLMTGVYVPTTGDINYLHNDEIIKLNGKKPNIIASMGLARTFQNVRLFKEMSVLDNVLISMHNHSKENVFESILRLPSFYRKEEALAKEGLELLAIFNLADKSEEFAKNLSYGDQRRLEIVRAIATRPQILFLDEPAAGMNPQETADLTQLIRKVQQDFNLTVLLIEHDMSLVMDVCERIYVLEYGKLIAHGTPNEIKNNPDVIKAYLGGEL